MKIAHKLTIAFVFVGLFVIGLAALFIYLQTAKGFARLVTDQRSAQFVSSVTTFYQDRGTWDGIDKYLQEQGLLPPPAALGQDIPDPQPFALVDGSRTVIVAGGSYLVGDKIQTGILNRGIQITIDERPAGTVLQSGQNAPRSGLEQKYLDDVQTSLWIAGGLGVLSALILGLTLSNSLSSPIKQLTVAARSMMDGDLNRKLSLNTGGELAELASAFNQLGADLDRANRLQRQMTADIAHDLNNPLTVIAGYTEAMKNGTLEPTPQRFSLIMAEVKHLQNLVADLRTLSLAETGELRLHLEEADVLSLLGAVKLAFQQRADTANVTIQIKADKNLPKIRWDGQRIRQVLDNLMVNALRHTTNGFITLEAYEKDGGLALAIRDTGSGIAETDLSRIFERSYRGDVARSSEGSGLGLAIARSILELHDGRISVESQLGIGSVFTITFPAQ